MSRQGIEKSLRTEKEKLRRHKYRDKLAWRQLSRKKERKSPRHEWMTKWVDVKVAVTEEHRCLSIASAGSRLVEWSVGCVVPLTFFGGNRMNGSVCTLNVFLAFSPSE